MRLRDLFDPIKWFQSPRSAKHRMVLRATPARKAIQICEDAKEILRALGLTDEQIDALLQEPKGPTR